MALYVRPILSLEFTPIGRDDDAGTYVTLEVEDLRGVQVLYRRVFRHGTITLADAEEILRAVETGVWPMLHREFAVQYPLVVETEEPFETTYEVLQAGHAVQDDPGGEAGPDRPV